MLTSFSPTHYVKFKCSLWFGSVSENTVAFCERLYMSPDVEYNVTSGISLGDVSVAEFCRLKHPSADKQCVWLVVVCSLYICSRVWLQWFSSCKECVVKVTSFRRSSVRGLIVGGLDPESEGEGI